MWIAWPAFLAACALQAIVFAMVDPLELEWAGHRLGWSRQAVYTGAFFVFWLTSAAACAISTLLRKTPREVNAAAPEAQRRAG